MADETPDSWRSLPKKDQLAILFLARLAEPITRTSLSTYIFFQLQSLDPGLTSGQIVKQAALLQAMLTVMQMLFSLPLSRLADSPRCGRKPVLLVGLGGLAASTCAFGFVTSFTQALGLRALEGAMNGNIVIIRAMASEVVRGDKRHQARAFLLMPLAFNVGALTGPPIAGALVEYAMRQHDVADGGFLGRWPYAPPMLLMGGIIVTSFVAVFLFLEETLPALRVRGQPDLGLRTTRALSSVLCGRKQTQYQPIYSPLISNDDQSPAAPDHESLPVEPQPRPVARLPLRRILTRNVVVTVSCHALTEAVSAGYNLLWPLFLSDAPIRPSPHDHSHMLFRFAGGAGLSPSQVALTATVLATGSLPMQLLAYPRVSARLGGPLATFRLFAWCLPAAFVLTPCVAVVAGRGNDSNSPWPIAMKWALITAAQLLMVLASAFAVPSVVLLTNNASPHPSALATTHGVAVMLGAAARTITPLGLGALYDYGQHHELSALVWWVLAAVASAACGLSYLAYEGSGHEMCMSEDDGEDAFPLGRGDTHAR